jgi:hypothetical protein
MKKIPLAAALALAGLSGIVGAQSLVLATPDTTLEIGQTFEVMVSGADFGAPMLGGGYGIAWNPAVLKLDSSSIDAAIWEFARSSGLHDPAAGTLTDAYFASNRAVLPQGSFAIGKLVFTAVGAGSSGIASSESLFFPFVDEPGNIVAVRFGSLDVNVAAIPEPGTWALLALGLGAIGLRRRAVSGA